MDPHAEPRTTDAFDLGTLHVDPAAGEIRGAAGREQLDPKVMEVLRVLHEQRGTLVPREVLFTRVWPDRIVTDDVLSRCIYQLRRQLAAAGGADGRELIETLPKRGYRLRAEAAGPEPPPELAATRAETRRAIRASTLLAAAGFFAVVIYLLASAWPEPKAVAPPAAPAAATAAAVAPTPPANSIAVLPFVDMSPDRDQAYLAEGLADELLSTLAERSALSVTARTSSFAMPERGGDAIEIGRRLGVAHIIEGSVRMSGERLRITADLVDARDGRRLWSRSYDRSFGDVLALQDEIAGEVARSLEATLAARGAPVHRGVPEANEAYLHGRFHFNRRAPGDVERARDYFRRAVELDPAHGQAWAGLAGTYALDSKTRGGSQHRDAVERALAVAPDLPEAHLRAMGLAFAAGDRDTSARHRARARELDPDDPLLLSMEAGFDHWWGRHDAAVAKQRRVAAQDPLSATAHGNLAGYLTAAGEYEEAKAELAKSAELNPASAAVVRRDLARILVLQGRADEAWRETTVLPAGDDRDALVAMLGPGRGEHALAAAALERLLASARRSRTAAVQVLEVHAYLGQREAAWTALRDVLPKSEPERLTRGDWQWIMDLRSSPFLASLRADPRWETLWPAWAGDS